MQVFAKKAEKKKWISDAQCDQIIGARTDTVLPSGTIEVDAPLNDLRKLLAKELKPGRSLISVVKFSDGQMHEATEADLEKSEGGKALEAGKEKKEPKAGVIVAKPRLGCPEPRLARAEIKARGVLETFLDEEQIGDFRLFQQFVSIGAGTGHRYMVTSRHNRKGLREFGGRQLYDLDEGRAFCVHHDALIPAAEEMLTLHLMLHFPEHEGYMRGLGGGGYGENGFGQIHS